MLKNKSLFISSEITAISSKTNVTTITFLLNEAEVKFYEEDAGAPDNSVVYDTTIHFK